MLNFITQKLICTFKVLGLIEIFMGTFCLAFAIVYLQKVNNK